MVGQDLHRLQMALDAHRLGVDHRPANVSMNDDAGHLRAVSALI